LQAGESLLPEVFEELIFEINAAKQKAPTSNHQPAPQYTAPVPASQASPKGKFTKIVGRLSVHRIGSVKILGQDFQHVP
jgi:hypothetical protein